MTLEERQKFLNEHYTGRLVQLPNNIGLTTKFKIARENLIYVGILIKEKVSIRRWQGDTTSLVKWINEKSNEIQNKENKAKENGS